MADRSHDDAAERLGLRYFLVSFTDLLGVQRAKLVPASAIGGMARAGRRSRASRPGST
jgi:hypothetical protein